MYNCLIWAWDVDGLSPMERLALVAVASSSHDDETAKIDMPQLMKRMCLSEMGVKEYLARLYDMELLHPGPIPEYCEMHTNQTVAILPESWL